MKKILLIVPLSTLEFGSSTTGGVDSVCQILLKDLVGTEYNEYQIRILAFNPKSKTDISAPITSLSPYIDILHVPIQGEIKGIKVPSLLNNLIRINKEISTFKPDIVHTHLAPWLLGIRGVKRVATLHSYKNIGRKPVSFLNDLVYAKFLPWLCDFYVDQYTCVGDLLKSELQKNVKTSVSIIGNPLNPAYFTNNHRLNTSKIKLVTCALLSRKKRIDAIIKLASRMHQQGLNIELTIIGPVVDNQYGEELEHLVKKEKAEQYITFTGSKNTDEIISLYAQSNVGIFLSSEETFGLAPLEMLASGLPLISSSVGIIAERPDLFTSIGTCIIDPTQEDASLTQVLSFIDRLPKIDCDALKNEFSVNAVNKQYFHIYKTLLNA
ncbi:MULTISPECIES: VpsD family glycosyltransferase [Aliivibrio]|uniref:Glycosyltransferase n=1 Tax=Aliivibrio finisterrensis TaxID=511998 RepID=A0A4Q5KT26_9GAMM|nr:MULTISPECIES: VpsD family glycosyltransferase [Aliivibrio]MDD9178993.1 VpsD family glycosyltransferase [Aliivibrio sp. A6]RYU50828.1 glycosyltransferase [Aliivibrio finisterrensis]RYU53478.1 glycosyltransferase [Aliivibrio finisterrensis]RYU58780.1 glycosyltransferase [Aliivibrio finisterrensis]RYU64981.1 glycosyltransferase [Aliivibrio finisterrensis]